MYSKAPGTPKNLLHLDMFLSYNLKICGYLLM